MKDSPLLSLFVGLLIFAATPLFAAKDKGLDILIAADAIPSPEGYRPKPGKPIYYLLFQSRETLGEPVGGVKLPDPALVEKAVVAELAKQNFVRAEEGGPLPDIAIFAVLGDSNFKDEILQGNPYNDPNFRPYLDAVSVRNIMPALGSFGARPDSLPTAAEIFFNGEEPLPPPVSLYVEELRSAVINEARRLRNLDPARKRNTIKTLVGANKVERALANRTLSSSAAEAIAMAAFDDQLYLSLSAVEAKKRPDGGRAFLWRTTMLIDWRVDFAKALPEMLAQAGPVFGTDVAVPGYVNTAKSREGKVEVGAAKVVNEKSSAPGSDEPRPKK